MSQLSSRKQEKSQLSRYNCHLDLDIPIFSVFHINFKIQQVLTTGRFPFLVISKDDQNTRLKVSPPRSQNTQAVDKIQCKKGNDSQGLQAPFSEQTCQLLQLEQVCVVIFPTGKSIHLNSYKETISDCLLFPYSTVR